MKVTGKEFYTPGGRSAKDPHGRVSQFNRIRRSNFMVTHHNSLDDSLGGWFVVRCLLLSGLVSSLLWTLGCGTSNRSTPTKSAGTIAEEDFQWAMERLNRAVKEFQPPSTLGIFVKREMNYEMFPPSEDSEYYTATVTISSKTTYDHNLTDDPLEGVERQEKKPRQQEFDPEVFSLPGEEGSDPEIERIPGIAFDAVQIEEPELSAREITETDEYDLVYKDDRWQLVDDIDVEHVKLWFEYALTL